MNQKIKLTEVERYTLFPHHTVGVKNKQGAPPNYTLVNRVFKNTEFYGGGETSENSLNEPAELSLRCLAKTENDHVCRALRH